MRKITWTTDGYRFDGKPEPFISGEFHYFRVPAGDWERRLELFKESGGNVVATYIPWIIHEPEEGKIVFGDQPQRDLAAFLTLCRKMGISVIVRPGPYVYSEIKNSGLPEWLLRDHPEIIARNARGETFRRESISYLHPVFLEKVRPYYRAVADVLRPFLHENGGPICLLQLDNEMGGVHIWAGTLDYNAETMGFGDPNGRYARWLKDKYKTVDELDRAYNKHYASFGDARPVDEPGEEGGYFGGYPGDIYAARRNHDYAEFYYFLKIEYFRTLEKWLREDGITAQLCHNPPNMEVIADFYDCAKEFGHDLLMGTDTYYTMNGYAWPRNNPVPQYALKIMMAVDLLKEMGQPPTTFEVQGGSPNDFPPILPEDIEACYMVSTGCGMKGLNYYIFTGGANFEDTGLFGDVYDFHAVISADGKIRPNYYAMQRHNMVAHAHSWLQTVSRKSNVTIGFCWEDQHWDEEISKSYSAPGKLYNANALRAFIRDGLQLTLMGGGYLPEFCEINNGLPLDRVAIVPCCQAMARGKQQKLVDFIRNGGRAIVGPVLPELDENYEPCTILADALGISNVRPSLCPHVFIETDDGKVVYRVTRQFTADCRKGKPVVFNKDNNEPIAFELELGKGRAIYLGADWRYEHDDQREFITALLDRLGGRQIVRNSNANIMETVWEKDDKACVFVYNLYSGAQETELSVFVGGKWHDLGKVALPAMKVECIDIDL